MEIAFKPGPGFSGAGCRLQLCIRPATPPPVPLQQRGQGSADLRRGCLAPVLLLDPGAMSLPPEADPHGKRSRLRHSICGTALLSEERWRGGRQHTWPDL